MRKAGIAVPADNPKHIFYFNYFVAKKDIYERYVKEMLEPCMKVMDTMDGLMKDARYGMLPEHLQKKFGITYYPYHPFICERMFSHFIEINNLKVCY